MTAMRSSSGRNRWLVATTLLAWVLLVVPPALVAPVQEPELVVVGQVLISGLLLGIGRQGIDILLLRLLIVPTGLLAGTVLGELKLGHTTMCPTASECVQSVLVGVLGAGLVGAVILAVVSIPATIAWNRGVISLRPEIRWPVPRKAWQWLLLLLVIAAIVFFSGLILGAPWPP
jgi:hypothetical protein